MSWRAILDGDDAAAARRAVADVAAALAGRDPGHDLARHHGDHLVGRGLARHCVAAHDRRDPLVEHGATGDGVAAHDRGDHLVGRGLASDGVAAHDRGDHLVGHGATGDGVRGYDLADGAAGVALLFGYLARVEGGAAARAIAEALLERAGDRLAAAPTTPSLFHGFTGVAWAADHLRALLGEPDLALNDDIDDAVLAWLDAPGGFDLVTGAVGAGVYALERRGHPAADRCAERVVGALARTAQRAGDAVWWTDGAQIDLGLAHGVAGAIALLARCVALGAGGGTARDLLAGAVRWLLAQRREGATAFPMVIGDRPAGPARAGWCYGDAAIALALVRASAVGAASVDTALAIAHHAALRPPGETGVRDATLCHGAAALAQIYQRLHHATGDPAMRSAARAWLAHILDHRLARPDLAASAGFFQASIDGPVPARGLMNGAAGIALVLLAASSNVAPDWDRALLL